MDLETERWRQEQLARRHPVVKAIDRWTLAVRDWCADHAATLWGTVLGGLLVAAVLYRILVA
jgi:hypothetical protein